MSKAYNLHLQTFALNLNFLSPRAYDFVRESFAYCLPHNRTIRKWYQKVGCAPGFTEESFVAIKKATEEAKTNNEILCVHLVFDEMHIRQHVDWDGEKSYGFVDLGDGGYSRVEATQVLVFLAVCINRAWKIPLGYFPIASLNAEQKTNLTLLCLESLIDTGVQVLGLTFDGAAVNFNTSKLLGCDIRDNTKEFFTIKNRPEKYIVHPDPCHMLKLVRNTLGDHKEMIDGEGNFIKWEYLEKLLHLQEEEGLHLGNKLRKAHIYFQQQKMQVKLAVQTFSASVADAIDFCREIIKLQEFTGSEATTKFIRIFNDSFDILNSRKVSECDYRKKALCENNVVEVLQFAEKAVKYISELKTKSGTKLIKSSRHAGFIGIIRGLRNLKILYERFIQSNILKFIPMYKVNQDHIELFFSSIRMGLGSNNNPSIRQFNSTYKKLVFRCQIRKGGIGNCLPLEKIDLLTVRSTNPIQEINDSTNRSNVLNEHEHKNETLEMHLEFLEEHSYAKNPASLSDYASYVVEYIAGFVVFHIFKSLHCPHCLSALQGESSSSSLIAYKSRGSLKIPSESVIFICQKVERELRRTMKLSDGNILKKETFQEISLEVQNLCVGKDLFSDHYVHMTETHHYSLIIKLIVEKFLQTRYYYIAKKTSEKLSVRQKYTKLILFNGM